MKTGRGGGLDEEQENIEVLELPFAKAMELVESGEIRDAKTILLLQHAKLHRLVEPEGRNLCTSSLPVPIAREPETIRH